MAEVCDCLTNGFLLGAKTGNVNGQKKKREKKRKKTLSLLLAVSLSISPCISGKVFPSFFFLYTHRRCNQSSVSASFRTEVCIHVFEITCYEPQLIFWIRWSVSGIAINRGLNRINATAGLGWTTWKKRWFVLTRTSLVFYRSDPNAVPPKGGEVNLTLGGIDLNDSGSVVVKTDKKLLTVLFADGRDGRAFTLKAETLEDLYEWKDALEEALAQAPSATLVMSQNGMLKNDQDEDAVDSPVDQEKERQPVKSMVLGRPILLALEDVDGTPSFLEKALRYIEEHGIKTEGILRQAADVEDVERRIREYEQGQVDFSPEEDGHVIGDCVKYVLRELPSSPVPASCCKALLDACRSDHSRRIAAVHEAICETFPEPNRRLLQRILIMMKAVASHKAVNRMGPSAVAACMAPLLLRPLLAGDCELEHNVDLGGDSSLQLLQAAAAANHAQAIVITLLEEYDKIFGETSISADLYSDTEESGSESEELTDDDYIEDDGDEYETEGSDVDGDEDFEHESNDTQSETGQSGDGHSDDKANGFVVAKSEHYLQILLQFNCQPLVGSGCSLGSKSVKSDDHKGNQKSLSSSPKSSSAEHDNAERKKNFAHESSCSSATLVNESSVSEALRENPAKTSLVHKLPNDSPNISNEHGARRTAVWGRTPAKKKLSEDPIEFHPEDEDEVERLEATKIDLQNGILEEAKGNAILQASLERRKKDLYERRLALEQDVARLQEQLQKERELRTQLEAELKMHQGSLPTSVANDEKVNQREQNCSFAHGNRKERKENQDLDFSRDSKSNGITASSSSVQPLLGRSANSKKYNTRGEADKPAQLPQRSKRPDH
ncbi:hypothetical protein NMG60_11031356 [Bertholletia excelsa]